MIKLKVNQIKVSINHSEDDVINQAIKKARADKKNLESFEILKKSIDSRKEPLYVYCVRLNLKKYNVKKLPKDVTVIEKEEEYKYNIGGTRQLTTRPVVVGFGPAGMFCAYLLSEAGYKPIVLERGKCVDERVKDVEKFWNENILNTESNVQFGEGGAGTFSDGKLNTGVKDKYGRQKFVLDTFIKFGAPQSIAYDSKPHIGTDILCDVAKNMRKAIENNGGEIRFCSKLTGIKKNGESYNLLINDCEILKSEICILAIGHSARDTFEMLYNNKFHMEQKPFAIGVRAEHKQAVIDKSQYGIENNNVLPPAPYKVTYNTKNKRGVYSFCMCPGGYVVNASSEEGRCAVNGMSYSGRNSENANSAIVTTIKPTDFPGEHPLAGMHLQRDLEERAYKEGKGRIPVQLYGDFKIGKATEKLGEIHPCIKGNYNFGNIKNILPDYICEAIEEAMPYFGSKIKGFDNEDVVFSAVESRTSSPVRIVRDESFQSNFRNIYPCGEGAGYAGGITSAAIDGIKVFEAVICNYSAM